LSMFPEIMNLRNLERVLAREEEVKKKAVVHKDTYDGPIVRFCSRDGNRCT
jgi:vacuolar protein sorting-associated protein 72